MTDLSVPSGSARIDGDDKNPKQGLSTTNSFGAYMSASSEKNLILITGASGPSETGSAGLYRFNTYGNNNEINDITSTNGAGFIRQSQSSMSVDGTVCAIPYRPSSIHYVNMYRTEDDWATSSVITVNTGITNTSYSARTGVSGNGEFMCVAVGREIRLYQWDGVSTWVYRYNLITGNSGDSYNSNVSLSSDGSKLLAEWNYGGASSSHVSEVHPVSAGGIIGPTENDMFNKRVTMAYEGDHGFRCSAGKLYVTDFSIFNGGEVLAYDTLQTSTSTMFYTDFVKGNYSIPKISILVGNEIHVVSPEDTGTAPDWSNITLEAVIPMDDFPATISSYTWNIISDGLLMLRYRESANVYKLLKIYYK